MCEKEIEKREKDVDETAGRWELYYTDNMVLNPCWFMLDNCQSLIDLYSKPSELDKDTYAGTTSALNHSYIYIRYWRTSLSFTLYTFLCYKYLYYIINDSSDIAYCLC